MAVTNPDEVDNPIKYRESTPLARRQQGGKETNWLHVDAERRQRRRQRRQSTTRMLARTTTTGIPTLATPSFSQASSRDHQTIYIDINTRWQSPRFFIYAFPQPPSLTTRGNRQHGQRLSATTSMKRTQFSKFIPCIFQSLAVIAYYLYLPDLEVASLCPVGLRPRGSPAGAADGFPGQEKVPCFGYLPGLIVGEDHLLLCETR